MLNGDVQFLFMEKSFGNFGMSHSSRLWPCDLFNVVIVTYINYEAEVPGHVILL